MIDSKIRKSQTFQKFTYRQRDLWQGLIEVADDQGRLPGNLPNVRSMVWPADDISISEIEKDLGVIESSGNIIRYSVSGCEYIQIVNWQKYQGESEWLGASEYPAPKGWHDRARFHGKNRAIITLNWGEVKDDIFYSTIYNAETKQKITLPLSLPYALPFNEGDVKGDVNVNGEGDVEGDTELQPLPNAYDIYEANIGQTTPFIADGIDNWLNTYPAEWIPAAIDEAVKNSARNFKYTDAILKRWAVDGFKSEKKQTRSPQYDPTQAEIDRAMAKALQAVPNG